MTNNGSTNVLRTVALIAAVAGAAGSVVLMLRTGSRNQSSVLMLMFAVWVLSPFVALALAEVKSTGWSSATRTTIHVLMLLFAVTSLSVYLGLVAMPAASKPAFPYLMVPLVCWLLIVTVLPLVAMRTR